MVPRPAPSATIAPKASTPVASPAPQVPQLGPMLTAEQQRTYDTAILEAVTRARQNIARARARSLNAQQKNAIETAEAFLMQAEKAHAQDPAVAKSLAERAELLSRQVAGQRAP